MISKTTERFWQSYYQLPDEIRKRAKQTYKLFIENPYHPSLHFKRIHSTRPVFSVRITKDYRAMGLLKGDEIAWFWIGSHAEYDKIIRGLR